MKIKICTKYPEGACSYYRSIGPLSKLSKLDPTIQVETISDFTWSTLADTDIVFFERPQSNEFLNAIKFTKDFGIPVWIDIDDDFFTVPKYNPSYKYFSQKHIVDAIEESMKLADIMTVTTDRLKQIYNKYNNNIIIIPNAFNDYNYKLMEQPSDNNIINWRGSPTHRNDILSCIYAIKQLSNNYNDHVFNFIGNDLWYIEGEIKNFNNLSEMKSVQYFKDIKNIAPKIQIAPLVFNEFNLSKSNISWIEGIYSGAVCVGPNMPEWNLPGIETYATQEEFYEKTDMLLKNKKKRIENFYKSQDYIKENLMLSIVNKKRIEVINNLI